MLIIITISLVLSNIIAFTIGIILGERRQLNDNISREYIAWFDGYKFGYDTKGESYDQL